MLFVQLIIPLVMSTYHINSIKELISKTDYKVHWCENLNCFMLTTQFYAVSVTMNGTCKDLDRKHGYELRDLTWHEQIQWKELATIDEETYLIAPEDQF